MRVKQYVAKVHNLLQKSRASETAEGYRTKRHQHAQSAAAGHATENPEELQTRQGSQRQHRFTTRLQMSTDKENAAKHNPSNLFCTYIDVY